MLKSSVKKYPDWGDVQDGDLIRFKYYEKVILAYVYYTGTDYEINMYTLVSLNYPNKHWNNIALNKASKTWKTNELIEIVEKETFKWERGFV